MFPFRRPDVPLDARTRRLLSWALGLWIVSLAQMLVLTIVATVAYAGLAWPVFRMLWIPIVACILLTMLGSTLFQRLARTHWDSGGRSASASLLAAQGWCPGCRTWLVSAARGEGNARTCPRCSSVWRVGGNGSCPGCGYDMSAVPATAGPLAICPECATLSVASSEASGSDPSPTALT